MRRILIPAILTILLAWVFWQCDPRPHDWQTAEDSITWHGQTVDFTLAHAPDADQHRWQVSGASFYELYGQRTACGQTVTRNSQWVAVAIERRKEFPCGTLIRLEWHGRELVVPVLDVCPGCSRHGRLWDMTAGTCHYLSQDGRPPRCNTGAIAWTR